MYRLSDDGQDGSQLFRELLRLLPSLCVEDYYKNGTWDRDGILLDFALIEHNREQHCKTIGSAPTPPALEDIPEVELLVKEKLAPWRATGSYAVRAARHPLPPPTPPLPRPPPQPPPRTFPEKTINDEQAVMTDFDDIKKVFLMDQLDRDEVTAMFSKYTPSQCMIVAKNHAHKDLPMTDVLIQRGGCAQSPASDSLGNNIRVGSETTAKTLSHSSRMSNLRRDPPSKPMSQCLDVLFWNANSWKVTGRARSRSSTQRVSVFPRSRHAPWRRGNAHRQNQFDIRGPWRCG